jgi:diadenosine tetraphosphate (Ap4A) HIT family hydrolase
MSDADTCQLCQETGGEILWQDDLCRIILVAGTDFPGYCRVVWKRHVREMTDLDIPARHHLMSVVLATEAAVRATIKPHKINLASLGNHVPHLHWHIVPRWRDDTHFPDPIWAGARRACAVPRSTPPDAALRAALLRAMNREPSEGA